MAASLHMCIHLGWVVRTGHTKAPKRTWLLAARPPHGAAVGLHHRQAAVVLEGVRPLGSNSAPAVAGQGAADSVKQPATADNNKDCTYRWHSTSMHPTPLQCTAAHPSHAALRPSNPHSRCAHNRLDHGVLPVPQLQAAAVGTQHAASGAPLVPAAAKNDPMHSQAGVSVGQGVWALKAAQELRQALHRGPGVPAVVYGRQSTGHHRQQRQKAGVASHRIPHGQAWNAAGIRFLPLYTFQPT